MRLWISPTVSALGLLLFTACSDLKQVETASVKLANIGGSLPLSKAAAPSQHSPKVAALPELRLVDDRIDFDEKSWQTKWTDDNLNKTLEGVDVEPHMVDGEPRGLVLTQVAKDSFFAKAGFQTADVIEEINGEKVIDPETALTKLREQSNRMYIRVYRTGSTKTIIVAIK